MTNIYLSDYRKSPAKAWLFRQAEQRPAGRCVYFAISFQLMPCPVSSALTARIPKNNALLVTIFLISSFIHITSELVLVKVYVREQGNMTVLEIGEYQATVPDKRCKGGAAELAGKGAGIEAYPAAENDDVQLNPDCRRTRLRSPGKDQAFAGRAFVAAGNGTVPD